MAHKQNTKTRKKKKKSTTKKVVRFPKQQLLLLGAIIAAFGFLLYANTLTHDYAFDDYSVIKDNYITKKGFSGIGEIFNSSYRKGYWSSQGTLYRPVSTMLFAAEWGIAPDTPALHHWINVLLYALTGLLLFLTLYKVLGKDRLFIACAAALLFMAHPLHTEVVGNIKSRDEILGFLFCIGTLYCLWKYFDHRKVVWLISALVSYAVAMFSKESSITFLAVIPLAIYLFKPKERGNLKIAALFILPVLLFMIKRQAVLGFWGGIPGGISKLDNLMASASFIDRLPTALHVMAIYLYKLLLPYPLVSDMGYSQIQMTGFGDWKALTALVLSIALLAVAILQFKKWPLLAFSIAFFFITFSIYSNIFTPIGSAYGERFLYMPSLAVALALAYGIHHFFAKASVRKPLSVRNFVQAYSTPLAVAGVLCLIYGSMTIIRNSDWKNSYTIYKADVDKAPNCAKLRYHYGLEMSKLGLEKQGDEQKELMEGAFTQFQKAIDLYPKYHDAYGQMGLAYYRIKDYDNALKMYEKSLEYKPNNATVLSNSGIIYFERKQLNKAREVYEKAVQINPAFVDARRNLGSVYAQSGQFDQAIVQFKEALKYAPNDATLHHYLGMAYRDKGDMQAAQRYLDRAYQLNPALGR